MLVGFTLYQQALNILTRISVSGRKLHFHACSGLAELRAAAFSLTAYMHGCLQQRGRLLRKPLLLHL